MNREIEVLLSPDRHPLPTGRAVFYLTSPMPMLLVLPLSYRGTADGQVIGALMSLGLAIVGVVMMLRQLVRGASGRVVATTFVATLVAVSPLVLLLYRIARDGLH